MRKTLTVNRSEVNKKNHLVCVCWLQANEKDVQEFSFDFQYTFFQWWHRFKPFRFKYVHSADVYITHSAAFYANEWDTVTKTETETETKINLSE